MHAILHEIIDLIPGIHDNKRGELHARVDVDHTEPAEPPPGPADMPAETGTREEPIDPTRV